jgi:diguanylate cyclase (GGDEF)-like protein
MVQDEKFRAGLARRWLWMRAALAACLCAAACAHALDPQRPLTEFTLARLDSGAGLPHNMVMALAQTPDGYLWAGTWEGLARWNGHEFRVFDRANTPELQGNGVRALAVGRDGSLWVGTARSGLLHYADGRWQRWSRSTGFPFDEVMAVHEDARGALWVSGEDFGVVRMDGKGVQVFGRAQGIGDTVVYRFAEDSAGGLYIAHGRGVDKLEGERFVPFGAPRGLQDAAVRALDIAPDGSMALSSGWELWRYDGAQFAPDPRQQLGLGEVANIGRDRDGALWIGTVNTGAWRLGKRGAEVLDRTAGLPQNRVAAWLEDREGSVWLGTNAGLAQLKDLPFASIDKRRGLVEDYIRALAEGEDGAIWLASSGGLARVRGDEIRQWRATDGLPSESLLSLATQADGDVWIGTYGAGVARLEGDRVVTVPGLEALADRQVRALLPRADGSLWIGTHSELARWQDGALQIFTTADGLPRNYVMALAEAPDGRLWIGTSNGLARWDGQRFEKFDGGNGFPARDVFSLYVQGDGTLWAGTNFGLVRGRDDKFVLVGPAQGLPHNAIFQVLDDGLGNLWMCSNKGAFRVPRVQVERAADEPGFTLQALGFDRLDGMSDTQCNGGSQAAALRASDGKLWFATASGASFVDPARHFDTTQAPSRIAVEDVRLDGIAQPVDAPMQIEAGPHKFEIRYAGLNLSTPQRTRYRYRLQGYESNWVEAGDARMATYTNLAPGSYSFEVAASHGGGWSAQPARFALDVLPRYWETHWFRLAVVLAGLLLVWGWLRWRISRARQNERHLAALVEERTRDLAGQAARLAVADREKSQLLETLRQQAEALSRLASEDSLTGLPNRREFDSRLARAFERGRHEGVPIAVALADVDHFKHINDTLSHAAGDEALRRLAQALQSHAGPEVFIARYGGEEFALLFTGAAARDATARCERLRQQVETMQLESVAPNLHMAVSLGVAHDDGRYPDHEKLLHAADAQLYAAKNAGRNRVRG